MEQLYLQPRGGNWHNVAAYATSILRHVATSGTKWFYDRIRYNQTKSLRYKHTAIPLNYLYLRKMFQNFKKNQPWLVTC